MLISFALPNTYVVFFFAVFFSFYVSFFVSPFVAFFCAFSSFFSFCVVFSFVFLTLLQIFFLLEIPTSTSSEKYLLYPIHL